MSSYNARRRKNTWRTTTKTGKPTIARARMNTWKVNRITKPRIKKPRIKQGRKISLKEDKQELAKLKRIPVEKKTKFENERILFLEERIRKQ